MAIGNYNGEGLEVRFSADLVENDHGVDGSPSWFEPENVEIDMFAILGVSVDIKVLPEAAVEAILELASFVEFEGE